MRFCRLLAPSQNSLPLSQVIHAKSDDRVCATFQALAAALIGVAVALVVLVRARLLSAVCRACALGLCARVDLGPPSSRTTRGTRGLIPEIVQGLIPVTSAVPIYRGLSRVSVTNL